MTRATAPGSIAAMAKKGASKSTGSEPNKQIGLRLEDELLERADALTVRENLTKGPFAAPYVKVTRAEVLRAAIVVGLAQLEREHGIASDDEG